LPLCVVDELVSVIDVQLTDPDEFTFGAFAEPQFTVPEVVIFTLNFRVSFPFLVSILIKSVDPPSLH
jgi:hypothetical protein